MRILIVMDPGILVPPKGYGAHERLVYMFAKEYARIGHEVHLLVTEGSKVEGCTVHPFGNEGFPPKKWDARMAIPKAWHFLWKYRNKFDLIHNFGRLAYLLPLLNSPVKKIMTYGRKINSRNINFINQLPSKNLVYTGCSNDLISRVKVSGRWETVYNAIPFQSYTLQSSVSDDAPLMFLGRIERIKGAHTAIAVAKAAGRKLYLSGNISPLQEEKEYFEKEIQPHVDGKQIIYTGVLNDEQKNYYLGQSAALLFPIEWNEPFGMVMVEAMACGTPVIGFNRGSVPEVIQHSVTGFVTNDINEMFESVTKIKLIDRSVCRKTSESLFDVPVIAKEYLNLFS